jgi:hypothetical protein
MTEQYQHPQANEGTRRESVLVSLVPTASMSQFLPLLFDTIVLQSTPHKLLAVEREAILTSIINCIGESVMREARASDTLGSKGISTLLTLDRFSNQWMTRAEFVQSIQFACGLDQALSDLALFFVEMRLDLLLRQGGTLIPGVGTVSSQSRPQSVDTQ